MPPPSPRKREGKVTMAPRCFRCEPRVFLLFMAHFSRRHYAAPRLSVLILRIRMDANFWVNEAPGVTHPVCGLLYDQNGRKLLAFVRARFIFLLFFALAYYTRLFQTWHANYCHLSIGGRPGELWKPVRVPRVVFSGAHLTPTLASFTHLAPNTYFS